MHLAWLLKSDVDWTSGDIVVVALSTVILFGLIGVLLYVCRHTHKLFRSRYTNSPTKEQNNNFSPYIYGSLSEENSSLLTPDTHDGDIENVDPDILGKDQSKRMSPTPTTLFKSPQFASPANLRQYDEYYDVDNESVRSSYSKKSERSTRTDISTCTKFKEEYLDSNPAQESLLLEAFFDILKSGKAMNLHTTKGPRPILFSLQNGEVRWQATRSSQKRYKLPLNDILYCEKGKKTPNFLKNKRTNDDLCFSLVTAKATLDLEVGNKLDRDCLAKGFDLKLKEIKSTLL